MGNIGNGIWLLDEADAWNCSKCANDAEFAMPLQKGDQPYLQIDLEPLYGPSARVCAVHINDASGRRLMSDMTRERSNIFYGPDRYDETKTDGYNLFTYRVPPIACEYVPAFNPGLCMLDLAAHEFFGFSFTDWLNWGTDPTWQGARVYVNDTWYDVKNNVLPPGWSWNPGTYKRYLIFPCTDAKTYNVHMRFKDANLNYFNSDVVQPFAVLPYDVEFCDCSITMTFDNYIANMRVDVNPGYGGLRTYTAANLAIGVQYIPGVAPSSQFVLYQSGAVWYVRIPVRCGIVIKAYKIQSFRVVGIATPIERGSCSAYTIPTLVTCFTVEFEIDDGTGCGAVRLFSEPFQCLPCPEKTLVIRSSYNGEIDCLGQVHSMADLRYRTNPAPAFFHNAGLLSSFSNSLRIPAVLRKLPSKVTVTKNDKCATYRSRLTQRYELQGTKAYPPYFALLVETIFAGQVLYINGERFEVVADTVFDTLKERGVSAFNLRVVLEKCPCEVTYDC